MLTDADAMVNIFLQVMVPYVPVRKPWVLELTISLLVQRAFRSGEFEREMRSAGIGPASLDGETLEACGREAFMQRTWSEGCRIHMCRMLRLNYFCPNQTGSVWDAPVNICLKECSLPPGPLLVWAADSLKKPSVGAWLTGSDLEERARD